MAISPCGRAFWFSTPGKFSGRVLSEYRAAGDIAESVIDRSQLGLVEGRAVAPGHRGGRFHRRIQWLCATYPVTIPGLVDLGFDGLSACSSYLVYFSWTLPFNSLFIAPTISSAASRVPIVDIVRSAGVLSLPLVFLSLLGFLKILGFRFFEWETQILFWSMGLGNALAIVLFTQIWPAYYLLTLVAGASISLGTIYLYGRLSVRPSVQSVVGAARPEALRRLFPPACASGPLLRCYWAS